MFPKYTFDLKDVGRLLGECAAARRDTVCPAVHVETAFAEVAVP